MSLSIYIIPSLSKKSKSLPPVQIHIGRYRTRRGVIDVFLLSWNMERVQGTVVSKFQWWLMNPSSIKGASFWGSWPLLILKTPKPQAHRFFLGSNRLLRRHLLFLRLRKKVTKRQGIHNSEVRSSWAPGVPNLPSLDICQKKSDSNIDLSGASRCCQGKVSHCFAVFSPPENPAHKKNDLNLQRVSGYRESTFTDLKPVEGSQVAKDQWIKSSGFPSYSIHKERKTAAYLLILSRLWAPFLSRSFLGVFDPR